MYFSVGSYLDFVKMVYKLIPITKTTASKNLSGKKKTRYFPILRVVIRRTIMTERTSPNFQHARYERAYNFHSQC